MSNTQTNDLGDLQGPLLIFGGPYGNLAATQALRHRAEIAGFKPEQIICNGDLVAYCGEPSQTVELIRDLGGQPRVTLGQWKGEWQGNREDGHGPR